MSEEPVPDAYGLADIKARVKLDVMLGPDDRKTDPSAKEIIDMPCWSSYITQDRVCLGYCNPTITQLKKVSPNAHNVCTSSSPSLVLIVKQYEIVS